MKQQRITSITLPDGSTLEMWAVTTSEGEETPEPGMVGSGIPNTDAVLELQRIRLAVRKDRIDDIGGPEKLAPFLGVLFHQMEGDDYDWLRDWEVANGR